jgi:hypothetical protein
MIITELFHPSIREDKRAQAKVRKWIKALRSEQYCQTTHALHNDGCFCCLGVACQVLAKGAWQGEEFIMADGSEFAFSVLPHGLAAELCLHSTNGHFHNEEGGSYCLSEANDNGYSFAQIADILEAGLALALG